MLSDVLVLGKACAARVDLIDRSNFGSIYFGVGGSKGGKWHHLP
jgi:hypothetical protein